MTKEALTQLREVHAIQGRDGCWDIDDYMLGLYNGLELALSIVENRACKYKQRPKSQPEQEPVAWISTGTARMIHWTADKPAYGDDWVPLYTTPPQREFVGLTDEETETLVHRFKGDPWTLTEEVSARLEKRNT